MMTILELCSIVFYILVFWLALCLLQQIFVTIRLVVKEKEKTTISQFLNDWLGGKMKPKTAIIFALISVAGIVNITLERAMPGNEIGGAYEYEEYTEAYDAILYLRHGEIGKDSTLRCIATIQRTDGDYVLEELLLPYGKYFNTWQEIELSSQNMTVKIDIGQFAYAELTVGQVANEATYEAMKNETSNDAALFASIESDKYHYDNCPYLKGISHDNLIWFASDTEAELCGYSFCERCRTSDYN